MWHEKELKYRRVLILLGMSCLSACVKGYCDTNMFPEFPPAGSRVAQELDNLTADEYPYLWEWIGRLDKLRQELATYN